MIKHWCLGWILTASAVLANVPIPAPEIPGDAFLPPTRPNPVNSPLVYESSGEAGPDETFFLVGENLSTNLTSWGISAEHRQGQAWQPRVQFLTNGYLAASMPERAQDGPFLVWVKNDAGYSRPILLNVPQPWWCGPDEAAAGDSVRVFGCNLSRRPDFSRALVYLVQPGRSGMWATALKTGKYAVTFLVPEKTEPGDYEVWLHAGIGGAWGWGGPVKLHVNKRNTRNSSLTSVVSPASTLELKANVNGQEIQAALTTVSEHGGGIVRLPAGTFSFHSTLRIPDNVTLRGITKNNTLLQLIQEPNTQLGPLNGIGGNRGPGSDRAAIWLAGNGAAISDLTIVGNAQVNIGIYVGAPEPGKWLSHCRVVNVKVADCDGKQGENCGLRVRLVDHAIISNNELWSRAPLFISGARQCEFAQNRLVSVTRYGGNAEAAILGRNETIEECIIENNWAASPTGAAAGGPTARRLIWLSTGHGSITHNWLADNGVEPPPGRDLDPDGGSARFGGVAGTDQNVGEMILFEANHRTAFFGPLAGADAQTVTLPKTIPATPDARLGNVLRKQLAHDAAGNETPFWPPSIDDGSEEPPIYEYFVTVFSGRGQGQTRRVVKRESERLWLDRPWNVPPQAGAIVAVGTGYYQNLIVGNQTPDGMTGIQLWISCVENVVSGNRIARQRKPGLFFYANGTTLASSMPRTWNRGISPLFWNVAEGNRTDECSAGALVTSGDEGSLPIEFPRALGNVVRHNSFIRSRTDGVIIASRQTPPAVKDTSPSIVGTIVEFNVVRDATVAYHAAHSCDAVVFRRNHAYFWYPVNNSTNAPVAFKIDESHKTVSLEQNSIEGIHGDYDGRIIDLQRPEDNSRMR